MLATAVVPNAAGQSILYAMGGRALGDYYTAPSLSKVMAYNVATNTWTVKTPLPYPMWGTNGAGVIDGMIYISGGHVQAGEHRDPRAWLFRYDPATDTWTRKHDMPTVGDQGVTGVIKGQLYVFTRGTQYVKMRYADGFPDRFYRYNPVTDEWTSLPSPSGKHRFPVGGVIDGKFYVVGVDYFAPGYPMRNDVYDPATNQWTRLQPPPDSRWFAAGAVQDGKLYVIGGKSSPVAADALRTMIVYDPVTGTWTSGTPLPTGRFGVAASRVLLNGQPRIEVVGGSRPGNNVQYIP